MTAYICNYRGGPDFESDYIPSGAECRQIGRAHV